MYIKTADNKTVDIVDITTECLITQCNTYPSLRIKFLNEISEEDIRSIISGPIGIYSNNNNLLDTYEGYTTLDTVSAVIVKITDVEVERDKLKINLEEATQKNQELESVLNDAESQNTILQNSLTESEGKVVELTDAINILVGGVE